MSERRQGINLIEVYSLAMCLMEISSLCTNLIV
jgi:hypothetical protein